MYQNAERKKMKQKIGAKFVFLVIIHYALKDKKWFEHTKIINIYDEH